MLQKNYWLRKLLCNAKYLELHYAFEFIKNTNKSKIKKNKIHKTKKINTNKIMIKKTKYIKV